MAAWIKMSLGMELALGAGDFVLDGYPAPPPQKWGGAPKFSAHVYCDQTAGWMKLVLGMEVGLSAGNFVLDGDLAPPPKGGGAPSPIFGPFYCGQTAGCIKMPLGMDVGLSPGDIVLDGDPVPLPKKEAETPKKIFGPCSLWPNGWMDQHATWHKGRPQPRQLCVRWGPSLLPTKRV